MSKPRKPARMLKQVRKDRIGLGLQPILPRQAASTLRIKFLNREMLDNKCCASLGVRRLKKLALHHMRRNSSSLMVEGTALRL